MMRSALIVACLVWVSCTPDLRAEAPLGPGLSLEDFSRTPATLDVSSASGVVTCSLDLLSTANPFLDAGCVMQSPAGKRRGCISYSPSSGTTSTGTWACNVTIPQDDEAGTWRVAYAWARDTAFAQLRATDAEMVSGSLPGVPDSADLDVSVTSTSEDTEGPAISDFERTPSWVLQSSGGSVYCHVTVTDASTISDTSCVWESPSGERISCIAAAGVGDVWSCAALVPPSADAGLWNLTHVVARDVIGNKTSTASVPQNAFTVEATAPSHDVFWVGHSLLGNPGIDLRMAYMVGEIASSLGLTYTFSGQANNSEPLVGNWVNAGSYPRENAVTALGSGNWDTVVLAELPPIQYNPTSTVTYAGNFLDAAVGGVPDARVMLYEEWHCHYGWSGSLTCTHDSEYPTFTTPWRQRLSDDASVWQGIADTINGTRSPPDITVAPVGSRYLTKLWDEIDSASMPGLTVIEDVFTDAIHPNDLGFYYIALSMTAILFDVDIRGASYAFNNEAGGSYANPSLPSSALADAMQQAVFEAWIGN